MSGIETRGMQVLEHFLDLTSQRESLIASNISNIDTPGFHTHDLNFKQEVLKAIHSPGTQLKPAVQEVKGLLERPDGNNVSLDREGLLLAQTQLQYRMGIELIKDQFHGMQMAIEEGK